MRVLGRAHDLEVEVEVGADGVAARSTACMNAPSASRIAVEVRRGAALRREAGRLGLDADAQLEHGDDVAHRGELVGADAKDGRVAAGR